MKNLALSALFSVAVIFSSVAAVDSGLNVPGGKKSKKKCKTEQKDCKSGDKKCCDSKKEGKSSETDKTE
jgi:hypothetical protein